MKNGDFPVRYVKLPEGLPVSLVPSLSNRPPFLSASVRAATSIRKGAPARENLGQKSKPNHYLSIEG